ncbi:ABC transporter substrate-binding protein [Pseudopedobacter saltans]|uniref:ABC transporter substrate-binding protein n=1 Tax=Pseudopedobacter saltans TaxID=151895 RepID=UPI0001EBC9AD|nr:ABC transporter substrate-binding protein [Pseudopedobacter saltans]
MEILGVSERNETLAEELQERVDIVVHKLKFFPDKPKIAFISDLNEIAVAYDESLNDIVSKGGGHLIYANSWESLLDMDPDILILSLNGESIESSLPKVSDLLQMPNFTELKAVKGNKIFILRNDLLKSELAAERVDVLESIAEIITPKYFNFGFEGSAWINFAV